MFIRIKTPPSNYVTDIAPRVEGRGDYIGEYGYALALTSEDRIRVTWDDGGTDDVLMEEVLFLHLGNAPLEGT